jgi:hypothetical protein
MKKYEDFTEKAKGTLLRQFHAHASGVSGKEIITKQKIE